MSKILWIRKKIKLKSKFDEKWTFETDFAIQIKLKKYAKKRTKHSKTQISFFFYFLSASFFWNWRFLPLSKYFRNVKVFLWNLKLKLSWRNSTSKKTRRCFFSLISVKIDSRFWIKLVNAKVNQLRIKVNFEARV